MAYEPRGDQGDRGGGGQGQDGGFVKVRGRSMFLLLLNARGTALSLVQ